MSWGDLYQEPGHKAPNGARLKAGFKTIRWPREVDQ